MKKRISPNVKAKQLIEDAFNPFSNEEIANLICDEVIKELQITSEGDTKEIIYWKAVKNEISLIENNQQ